MALEVPREQLEAIIADRAVEDHEKGMSVEGALAWLGWHEDADGPMFSVERRALLDYLWYRLPAKCAAGVEEQLETAEALASALERFGERGREYAAICRSPQTAALIRRWSHDPAGARKEMGAMLDRAGIEPPDLAEFQWGRIMGLTEALAAEAVGARLEDLVERGTTAPGEPGWAAVARGVTSGLLAAPAATGDPRATWREAIDAERIARWADPPDRPRHAICGPAAALFEREHATPSLPAAGESADVLGWLFAMAADGGIALTQTHAMARAVVRECVERRPSWYPREWGPPHRETDVPMVSQLADLLRASRLLRRRKNAWLATREAKVLADDPVALRVALLARFLGSQDFTAAVGQLGLAVLVCAPDPVEGRAPAALVTDAIRDDGWLCAGEPPGHWDIYREVASLLRVLIALDLNAEWSERGNLSGHLDPDGRHLAVAALREVAAGPKGLG